MLTQMNIGQLGAKSFAEDLETLALSKVRGEGGNSTVRFVGLVIHMLYSSFITSTDDR